MSGDDAGSGTRGPFARVARVGVVLLAAVAVAAVAAWCVLAIYFSDLPGRGVRLGAATAFGVATLALFLVVRNRRLALAGFGAGFLGVLLWWNAIPASNDRDWRPEVGVLPVVEFGEDGRHVTVRGVRDFEYRTADDFTPRYDTRTYDLDGLRTMDLVLSDWGIGDVVHTMLSFGFEGDDYLAVSVETRLERGEPQSGLRGLFKQYELIYVLADERDLLRLRTDFRGEDVYVYPTTVTPAEARVVLTDILETAGALPAAPRFYNTITHNCTTSMLPHLKKARWIDTCDIRFLLNGQTVERAYSRGTIRTDVSLEETRRRFHVNRYLREPYDVAEYSLLIRPSRRER